MNEQEAHRQKAIQERRLRERERLLGRISEPNRAAARKVVEAEHAEGAAPNTFNHYARRSLGWIAVAFVAVRLLMAVAMASSESTPGTTGWALTTNKAPESWQRDRV